jgi:hypothetical protein
VKGQRRSCGSPGFPAFGREKSPAKRDLDDISRTNKTAAILAASGGAGMGHLKHGG